MNKNCPRAEVYFYIECQKQAKQLGLTIKFRYSLTNSITPYSLFKGEKALETFDSSNEMMTYLDGFKASLEISEEPEDE